MVESISAKLLGIIVLIMAVILVAERYRREHHGRASRPDRSHTTVRTGLYPAVRIG